MLQGSSDFTRKDDRSIEALAVAGLTAPQHDLYVVVDKPQGDAGRKARRAQ